MLVPQAKAHLGGSVGYADSFLRHVSLKSSKALEIGQTVQVDSLIRGH